VEIKRLNFRVPMPLYNRFKILFPYPGELTAFFRRCMEAAVLTEVSEDVFKKIEEHINGAREDTKSKRGY